MRTICECVSVCVYAHHMCAILPETKKASGPQEMMFEEIMSHVLYVLGIELKSSEGAVHSSNH